MPRRQARRTAPAPDGTWERCAQSVFCHEDDCFPRALCVKPFAIALIFAFVFSLDRNIEAAGPTKAIFAAVGAIAAAAIAAFLLSGLPGCRRAGCARGAQEDANETGAALVACFAAPVPPPPPPPPARGKATAPEFAVTAFDVVTVANPIPATFPTGDGKEAAGREGGQEGLP